METRLRDLAAEVGGTVEGDGELPIRGVAGIKEAGPEQVTFLGSARFEDWLERTAAAAIILPSEHPYRGRPTIRVSDPYEAFRRAVEFFHRAHRLVPVGVHPTALIGANVALGANVAVGPYVVLGERCRIGAGTTIMPGVVIGPDVTVGVETLIYPGVVIREGSEIGARVILHAGAVVGDDGFGFLTRDSHHGKMPQVGRVIVEDDVEVGSNTCIDRATVGVTRVRRGTRIDNLVQVAHNVEIGEDSMICAQVGIAGSTRVGSGVVLGGQAGIVHHVEIGDGARVGGQGGVTKSVPPRSEVSGYPAQPHALARRMYAALRHLPEALRELRRLAERVAKLEEQRGRRT